jgi:hypothetical protein
LVDVPLTVTWTQTGFVPVVSETVTLKVNAVAVVPVPGVTIPFLTVIVPQVRACTGATNPVSDAVNQPARAKAPTNPIWTRRRCWMGKPDLPLWFEGTECAPSCQYPRCSWSASTFGPSVRTLRRPGRAPAGKRDLG